MIGAGNGGSEDAMTRQAVQSGFSRVAEALSDPAREAIVSALADGKAMPAGELAAIAGVSPQSASAHLQKLVDARVLSVWAQGRFRYYRIADDDVAALIENLVNLAAKTEARLPRRDVIAQELRQSRSCYCHLAGRLGVLLSRGAGARQAGDARWPRRTGDEKGHRVVRGRADRIPSGTFASCPALQRLDGARAAFFRRVCQRDPDAPDGNAMSRVRRIPRALRLTRKGRAFFGRLGVEVPF